MKFSKLIVLILLPTLAHAQQGSHGGDTRCEEFYQLASEISINLAKVGQERINAINPLINVSTIREVLLHPVQVLPAHSLDRQALSNPDSLLTQLDVEQWDSLNRQKRIKLVSHELLVLTRREADGEYLITQDLLAALSESPLSAEPKFRGMNFATNAQGTKTFYVRQTHFISANSNPLGVCKYISNEFSIARNIRTDKFQYRTHRDLNPEPLVIDENGVVVGRINRKNFKRLTQIDCG